MQMKIQSEYQDNTNNSTINSTGYRIFRAHSF